MKNRPLINVRFPLDFEILSADRKRLLSGLQDATATQVNRDIARVKFTPTEPGIESKLYDTSSILSLIIHIPNYYKPLTAYGKAKEIEEIENINPPQIRMVIDLIEMKEKERKLLVEYARWVKWRPRFLVLLFIIIIALVSSAVGYSYYLMREDLRLRAEIRDAGAESKTTMRKLRILLTEKTKLEMKLMSLEQRLAEQIDNEATMEKQVIGMDNPAKELKKKLRAAEKEKERLKEKVESLRKAKGKLETQIATKTEVPAETIRIFFKNGQSTIGKLIESDEEHIKVNINYLPVTFNRKLVKRVEFVTTDRQIERR